MSSFWGSFFEHLKDCGRNASIFIITVAAMAASLVLIVVLDALHAWDHPLAIGLGVGVLVAAWIAAGIRRYRARRRNRLSLSPLSQHDMDVAKQKLRGRRA